MEVPCTFFYGSDAEAINTKISGDLKTKTVLVTLSEFRKLILAQKEDIL